MERKSQLALEFISIVAISAIALAFSVALLFSGFSGIEGAALRKNVDSVESFLSFAGKAGGPGFFSLKESVRVFPTGELAVFSDGDETFAVTCGRFSGFSARLVSEKFFAEAGATKVLESDCSGGRFLNGKGLSGKLAIKASGNSLGGFVVSLEKETGAPA